jgi:hypothetical protein
MSWTNQNALKRVFSVYKRFKEQNGKLWDNDIEAIKTLNLAIENASKSNVNDNLLFAKLLVYVLDRNVHHNGDIKASIKIVADILKEPLNYHLQMFKNNLNQKGIDNYLKSLGLNLDHLDHSKEKQETNDKILKENQKEIIEKMQTNWTYENVSKSFYNTANEFLQQTDNYI